MIQLCANVKVQIPKKKHNVTGRWMETACQPSILRNIPVDIHAIQYAQGRVAESIVGDTCAKDWSIRSPKAKSLTAY